jgi:hypothetical protein
MLSAASSKSGDNSGCTRTGNGTHKSRYRVGTVIEENNAPGATGDGNQDSKKKGGGGAESHATSDKSERNNSFSSYIGNTPTSGNGLGTAIAENNAPVGTDGGDHLRSLLKANNVITVVSV